MVYHTGLLTACEQDQNLIIYLFIYLSNLSMDKLDKLVHLVGFIIKNLS
jgi:hypothetical protein